jgi:hypothetical protein
LTAHRKREAARREEEPEKENSEERAVDEQQAEADADSQGGSPAHKKRKRRRRSSGQQQQRPLQGVRTAEASSRGWPSTSANTHRQPAMTTQERPQEDAEPPGGTAMTNRTMLNTGRELEVGRARTKALTRASRRQLQGRRRRRLGGMLPSRRGCPHRPH